MPSDEQAERVRAGIARAGLAQHLSELIAVHEINCVLDVGAHRGEYGAMLRGIGYAGPIASFEPVGSSFGALEERIAGDPSWSCHRVALGSAPGEMQLTVYEEDTTLSAGPEPTEWARSRFTALRGPTSTETAVVDTLDNRFAELVDGIPDPRPLLKIDVQGNEWHVLEGARRTLGEIAAAQVEASVIPVYDGVRSFHDVIEALGRSGLELSGAFPVTRDPDLRIVELDCVFVRTRGAG